ncbi:MAG: SRPBCC family protein [Kofleriaceae bacterium]|nr:SRPBCC family protein [Kofleriaceae bacterium]
MDSIDAFRSNLADKPPNNNIGLVRGLGIFSLALGAVELAKPGAIARVVGAKRNNATKTAIRAIGVREVAAGVSVLARPRRAWPLWSRVVGDAIDLGMIGLVGRAHGRKQFARVLGAALAVAGVMALDVRAARRAHRPSSSPPIVYAVTINKSPSEVYAFFRTLSRLPLFMDYLESVTEHGDTSHWVAKLPVIGTVAWDAKLKADRPGQLIEWETVPGSTIKQHGRVTFTRAPGRNATEMRLELRMGVRGTPATEALAKLLAKPEAKGDLKRLKQVIETGEVLYSDATEHARPYPAQPARHGEHKHPRLFAPNPPMARKEGAR